MVCKSLVSSQYKSCLVVKAEIVSEIQNMYRTEQVKVNGLIIGQTPGSN